LGFLWQALAQGLPKVSCEELCNQRYRDCIAQIPRGPNNPNPVSAEQACGSIYHSCRGNCTTP
jgi:hypothetical protein